jgi:hypothetical protein
MRNIKKNLEKANQENVDKKLFVEPKVSFIEPKLIKHGDATKITAGFFGGFSPSA